MGLPDGYNSYPSIEGQNNADNDESTDLVTPNEDGTIVERLEALKDQLASLGTTELTAVLTAVQTTLPGILSAIEGSGFSALTDSLKILSDVLDEIKGYIDTEVAAIKAKTDNLPASPCATADVANALVDVKNKDVGATFDASTDSLEAIRDAIDNGFALTGDAEVANVLDGKFFYKDNYQTKLEGTMPNNAGDVAAISASMDGTNIKVVPATGYVDGVDDTSSIDLTTVDADLVTGNIKSGITLFGVAGKSSVVETDDANAVAGDIALGKTAYVNGVKITGTAE